MNNTMDGLPANYRADILKILSKCKILFLNADHVQNITMSLLLQIAVNFTVFCYVMLSFTFKSEITCPPASACYTVTVIYMASVTLEGLCLRCLQGYSAGLGKIFNRRLVSQIVYIDRCQNGSIYQAAKV